MCTNFQRMKFLSTLWRTGETVSEKPVCHTIRNYEFKIQHAHHRRGSVGYFLDTTAWESEVRNRQKKPEAHWPASPANSRNSRSCERPYLKK